jgi:outer membrane receptor protein involved in Fe transport
MQIFHSRFQPSGLSRTPIATAVMLALASPALMAQEQTTLGEVTVTAQKREENLQNVPISLTSLNTKALEELNIQSFKSYVKFLPTVSTTQAMEAGSGFNLVYMRGVATGGDGQATTSQPSVGTYLDEQPITTVQGNLDVHLYDVARVEALAGPQGTLYGASSQSGTIRIITNKPDPSGFAAGYSLEGNYVDGDDGGYVAEGFVNIPVGDNAAVRLVGWAVSEAGWIDNVLAPASIRAMKNMTRPYPHTAVPRVQPPAPRMTTSRTTRNSSRTTTTPSIRSARVRRYASTWVRTGPSRPARCTRRWSRREPGATIAAISPLATTMSRISGTNIRTTSSGRWGSRSRARSATSTSCTRAITSSATSTVSSIIRITPIGTTTTIPPVVCRLLCLPVRRQRRQLPQPGA